MKMAGPRNVPNCASGAAQQAVQRNTPLHSELQSYSQAQQPEEQLDAQRGALIRKPVFATFPMGIMRQMDGLAGSVFMRSCEKR